MRCALYLRVSTEDQKTDLQLDELTRYADLRQWPIVEIYQDHFSGTTDKRPAFQKMLRDAHERRFDMLLVWKLDRFGRSLKDLINNIHRLQELGVEFSSFKDQIDLSTSHGKLLAHLLMAFSEFEASSIRLRVKSGMAAAKARGKHVGRPKRVNDNEVVRLRNEGQSLTQIAKQLHISRASVANVVKKAGLNRSVRKVPG